MPGFVVNAFGSGAPATVKPYYKYTWEIQQFYGEDLTGNLGPEQLPLVYLLDAATPRWNIEAGKVLGASLEYKFAKSMSWGDIKIVWYDTVGLADKVRQWRQSIWTPDEGLKSPSEYKKQSIIRSLTFNWDKPVGWKLFNSWPQSVHTGDLSYADSNIKTVEVNLAYDWAEEIVKTRVVSKIE